MSSGDPEDIRMNVIDHNTTAKNFTRAQDVEIPEIYYRKFRTGIEGLDDAFGGQGFLPGAVMMLSAPGGVGKSTFSLQLLEALENTGKSTAFISGEETIIQISLAARRIGANHVPVANITYIEDIEAAVLEHGFDFVVIDSFPTIMTRRNGLNSREKESYIIGKLVRIAKTHECCLLIIQHCTKDGNYKGGTELLHAVDAHFSLHKNEEDHDLRDFEAHKNRFGACSTVTFPFGSHGYTFECVETESEESSPKKKRGPSKRDAVLEVLDTPKTVADIVKTSEVSGGYLTTLLRELVTEGVVMKLGRGSEATYIKAA
jgi:predicted ATP-dependent serine protease